MVKKRNKIEKGFIFKTPGDSLFKTINEKRKQRKRKNEKPMQPSK